MNPKTMFKLSYGLFVLTAKEKDFDNGCIINTCIQVTSTPNQVSIAVNKNNKTCQMIDKTGVFNVSILSEKAVFDVFKHFGFQSGNTVDKFADFSQKARSENGLYYITDYANAYLSGKVVSKTDLGTHILFIAKVTDGEVLSDTPSVTYTYYQEHIKPAPEKPKAEKPVWVCKICGYVYEGDPIPADFICPVCKHGAADFERK